MLKQSPYKLGLGPKILGKVRLILGSLLLLLTIITTAGIYHGISSGDFNKVFLKPFKEFGSASEKASKETPTPIATKAATLQSPSPPHSIKKQIQPVVLNCIKKNIREGEFASNKCYLQQDYEDLNYYLQRFDSAVFAKNGAESSMRITCNCRVQQECDFFKDSCEKDKQQKSKAEADIQNYKATIQGIITRGK